MPKYPRCYFSRRTFVILNSADVSQMGYVWTEITFPDCQVWRMHWFAATCRVNIDDIHAFQAAGGRWRYCFASHVRPFAKYDLNY